MSAAAEPAYVPVAIVDSIYYWSGDYLHIDGIVGHDYAYALNGIMVHFTVKTPSGEAVADDATYASGYRLNAGDDGSFSAMLYLPGLAGSDMDCALEALGREDVGVAPISLTLVSRSVSFAYGLRVYSVVYRNDSLQTVEHPVLGGWETDADGLTDTLFAYQDAVIPPGESITMEAVGFLDIASPQVAVTYCEAMPVVTYTITPSAGAHGSISPNTPRTVNTGASSTFAITPATGYRVAGVLVDGASAGAVTSYTFTGVTANHTISATFVLKSPATIYTPHAPSTMSHSRYYTIYGYLKPFHTSGTYPVRIYKWRYVSGRWKSYGYTNAKASKYYSYSKYSRSIRLPYRGRWKVRAYAPADSVHAAKWSSGYDYVTVK